MTTTPTDIAAAGMVKAGGDTGDVSALLESPRRLGVAIDGTPDELWLLVRPFSTNADLYGALIWREV